MRNDYVNELLDGEIKIEEVRKAIQHLKANKTAGPDVITAELLKDAQNEIILYLVHLFNELFTRGIFPSEWTKAIIISVHKKGNIDDRDNFRGISLLSILI